MQKVELKIEDYKEIFAEMEKKFQKTLADFNEDGPEFEKMEQQLDLFMQELER